MALKIYDTLAPQGSYPAVKAEAVEMPDGTRLSEFEGGGASVFVQEEEPVNAPVGSLWYDTDEEETDAPIDLSEYAKKDEIPTDEHIKALIREALEVVANGTY